MCDACLGGGGELERLILSWKIRNVSKEEDGRGRWNMIMVLARQHSSYIRKDIQFVANLKCDII